MESFLIKVEIMEQIINYIPLVVFTIFGFLTLGVIKGMCNFYKRTTYINGFGDYIAVLEFHMSKAYDLIHKDRILIYSLEGMRIKDEEFNVVSQDFVKLVIKFIGPSLQEDFTNFYGNEETFIFSMVEYFNTRYEEDTIRKDTMEEISSDNQGLPEVKNYEPAPGTWSFNPTTVGWSS